jgi:hypothetical protein
VPCDASRSTSNNLRPSNSRTPIRRLVTHAKPFGRGRNALPCRYNSLMSKGVNWWAGWLTHGPCGTAVPVRTGPNPPARYYEAATQSPNGPTAPRSRVRAYHDADGGGRGAAPTRADEPRADPTGSPDTCHPPVRGPDAARKYTGWPVGRRGPGRWEVVKFPGRFTMRLKTRKSTTILPVLEIVTQDFDIYHRLNRYMD